MAELETKCLTPEQLEARLNDLAQIYELGMALREARFLDPEEERAAARTRAHFWGSAPNSTATPGSDGPPTS